MKTVQIHPRDNVAVALEPLSRGAQPEGCPVLREDVPQGHKLALRDIDSTQLRRIIIAYEPIWAIGTGCVATPEQADRVGEAIRESLRAAYGARAARGVSILYGGSLSEKNARDMLAMPDVDGGLIGGASLEPESLDSIIQAANQ